MSDTGGGPPGGKVPEDRVLLAVLALGPEAEDEEIRTAYRRLARRLHPDASKDPATAGQFARVSRAYKLLRARPRKDPGPAGGELGRYRAVLEAGEDLFALGQVLGADPDPGAREAAVMRLGLSGRTAAYVFLRQALYDPAESVALAAVRASALLGCRQAEGEIAALYSRSSLALRTSILETARATREVLFASTVKAALRDPEPALRRLAAAFSPPASI